MVIKESIEAYFQNNYSELYRFWTSGNKGSLTGSIEENCDLVYSLYLSGSIDIIEQTSVSTFVSELKRFNITGFEEDKSKECLNVHNSAYLFGTINILSKVTDKDLYGSILSGRKLTIDKMIQKNGLPSFPKKYAHHTWRVSHWLGGVPSIIYSLIHKGNLKSELSESLLNEILIKLDDCLDTNGDLVMYNSELVQNLFRSLYRIRHDPDLANIGGVVHIHWINYLMGREYKSGKQLSARAIDLFLKNLPFMEGSPYCLDFDIIQLIRTGVEKNYANVNIQLKDRVSKCIVDLIDFLENGLDNNYRIHRLPGALASLHESCLLNNVDVPIDSIKPIDIIKSAYWL